MIRPLGHLPDRNFVLPAILFLVIFLHAHGVAQNRPVRGTVTFMTSEYVYTTLGRNDSLHDSSRVMVISRRDTIAVLKVFAMSSKSSACVVVSSKRTPAPGDTVVSFVPRADISSRDTSAAVKADTAKMLPKSPPAQPRQISGMDNTPPWIKLQGRVSLQDLSFFYSDSRFNQSEPGVGINMTGKFTGSDLSFQIAGNFRTLLRDKNYFTSASSSNQTRVYRLSVDYNDSVNAFSLGRIIPVYAPLIGSVDGASYAHTFGILTLGLAGGFEPSYVPGISYTDMRKFSVFGTLQTSGRNLFQGTAVYSRSYHRSQLTRDLIEGSILWMASDRLSFTGQTDVDLRTHVNNGLSHDAQFTSINASFNYAVIREFSLGLGVSAWRPTYFFEVVQSFPDNFLDTRLRTTPYVRISLNLPGGISAMNSYSPRTSDQGFGKEYMNSSTLGWSDQSFTKIFYRATYTVNTTELTTVRGWTITAQRSISTIFNLDARYQTNRFDLLSFNQRSTTHALALDLLVSAISRVSFWISAERNYGMTMPYTSLFSELSYHF